MNLADMYEALTVAIGDETGASDTLLHVHAGMFILLATRVITRKSLASFVPFTAVLIAALANEGLDRVTHGSWRWHNSIMDVLNTIFWPFVLMVGLRVRRSRSYMKAEDSCEPTDLANLQ